PGCDGLYQVLEEVQGLRSWLAPDIGDMSAQTPLHEAQPVLPPLNEEDDDMTTVSEPKRRKPSRPRASFQADVSAAVECLVEEIGKVPSVNQVAILTGIGWSTVKKYWPQEDDDNSAPSVSSVTTKPVTEVETPIAVPTNHAGVMIHLPGIESFQNEMIEGVMKVGNDVWKCDILAQRNGMWVPQLYAWRVA
ncbi:MAG: hypothetical protein ACOH2J_20500, partial [Allorhizobium sp.]